MSNDLEIVKITLFLWILKIQTGKTCEEIDFCLFSAPSDPLLWHLGVAENGSNIITIRNIFNPSIYPDLKTLSPEAIVPNFN